MIRQRKSKPPTILLVDDDADCRLLARQAIESALPGVCVVEASDGGIALECILRAEGSKVPAPAPDLVFLDMHMPGVFHF